VAEIDAIVARLFEMTADQLEYVFADFPETEPGASMSRRAAVRAHFTRLSA
jgi:hypothetical protein